MRQQRIHERAVAVTGGGMDDQASGFIDDDEVGVLVHNMQQRHCLRLRCGGSGGRHSNLIDFARFDPVAGVPYGPPRERNLARLQTEIDVS